MHKIPGDCSTERKLVLRVEGLLEKRRAPALVAVVVGTFLDEVVPMN